MTAQSAQSPADQLDMCLNDVVEGAGLPFATGVRDEVFKKSIDLFTANASSFPSHVDVVRRSARFIGRFAALFAQFDSANELRSTDVWHGIAIVKPMCKAFAERLRGSSEPFLWCPDPSLGATFVVSHGSNDATRR